VFLQYGKAKPWFFHRDETRVYRSDGKFRTANAGQLHAAVMQHLGIANAPSWRFGIPLSTRSLDKKNSDPDSVGNESECAADNRSAQAVMKQ